MNKEIKEIISKYKMYMKFDGNEYEMIQKVELHKLLDYITNLEKRNKEIYDGFKATQEELTEYAEVNKNQMKYIAELLVKIDKAIEYIQNESWFCFKDNEVVIDRTPVEKLIEILRGVINDG